MVVCLDRSIPLETGSPAFPVPPALEEAICIPGASDEWTEYPPLHGLPALREMLAQCNSAWSDQQIAPEQVLITHGAMNALFTICSCLLQPGDEVLIPAPYWRHFPNILKYFSARLIPIPTTSENNYKLTPQLLKEYAGPASRLLIMTTPNNPTGTIYSQAELDGLMDAAMAHPHLAVISDEAYNLLPLNANHDKPLTSSAIPCPGMRTTRNFARRLFRVGSISKNFGLAGLRVGYVLADQENIEILGQRQRFSALGVNQRLQQGALAVLEHRDLVLGNLLTCLNQRRRGAEAVLARLLPEMKFCSPQAGYYFFANVAHWLGKRTPGGELIENDIDLARWLETQAEVCIQPSGDCGFPGFFRLTFALPPEEFEEGVSRMKRQFQRLV